MSASPNLQLPYLDANQNQKSVTHNQALRMLDALVGLGVQSCALQAPPAVPADGGRWIVASGGTGAWAGKDLNVAAWQDGAWSFYAPLPGFVAFDAGQNTLVVWTGAAWAPLPALLQTLGVAAVGVGTAADKGNPLSATLNNALFNALPSGAGGTGDVRVKLNKATAGNTASFLFQDGFAGRAEIGLAGDDNFHFKVSADGASFFDAIVVAGAGAAVSFLLSPTAPTPTSGDSSTKLATTAFVAAAVGSGMGGKGSVGATGATGPQGAAGAAGASGATGPQGATGATGPMGAAGSQGAAGTAGATGQQGVAGAAGASGAAGLQGAAGATGPMGAAGSQGATGSAGATGPQGTAGAAGASGATGPQGAAGATGPMGAAGSQGAAGTTGAMGPQGTAGIPVGTVPTTSGTTQVAAAADSGKVYLLSGTSTLQLPPAVQVANWYCRVRKADGSGVWAITPTVASGTPPTIDGLASINCYQESYLIWWDAAAAVFRTQERPKGWISVQGQTVLAGQSLSIFNVTAGFLDPEIGEVEFRFSNLLSSAASAWGFVINKGGANQTGSTYYADAITEVQSTTPSAITGTSASSSLLLVGGTATSNPVSGVLSFRDTLSTTATDGQVQFTARYAGATRFGYIFESTAGKVGGFGITPTAGTMASITYVLRGYRM